MSKLGRDQLVISYEDDEDVVVSRHNTTLYTFWGSNAMFNHVFVEFMNPDPEDTQMPGYYIFCNEGIYPELASFIAEHQFPQELNKTQVPECDKQAFYDKQFESMQADPLWSPGDKGEDT